MTFTRISGVKETAVKAVQACTFEKEKAGLWDEPAFVRSTFGFFSL